MALHLALGCAVAGFSVRASAVSIAAAWIMLSAGLLPYVLFKRINDQHGHAADRAHYQAKAA